MYKVNRAKPAHHSIYYKQPSSEDGKSISMCKQKSSLENITEKWAPFHYRRLEVCIQIFSF